MKKTAAEVIKELMKLGVMASMNQVIDYDTAEIVATEMGAIVEKEIVITIEDKGYEIGKVKVNFITGDSSIVLEPIVGKPYEKISFPTISRTGYIFTGWYTEAENGEPITADSTVNVETSQTLYAHWKQLTSTLVFDANGGSVSDESKLVYIGGNISVR